MPRDTEGVRYFHCYGELVAFHLKHSFPDTDVYFYNRSYSDATATKIANTYRSDSFYFGNPGGHIAILQCGIVDCAPRPIPPKMRSIISRLPASLRNLITSFIHKHRASMLRSGLIWRVTPPHVFFSTVIEMLKLMTQAFSRVYVVNIAPTTSSTEAHSPGLSESINHYNSLIREALTTVAAPNARLIDVHTSILSQAQPLEIFISRIDGHHITITAHQLYAALILEQECKFRQSSSLPDHA